MQPSQVRPLETIALRVDELLIQPSNMQTARTIVESFLKVRENDSAEPIPFPWHPDEPGGDVLGVGNPGAELTKEQTVAALVALHEVYCSGVTQVVCRSREFPENASQAEKLRAAAWGGIVFEVRQLRDWSSFWFELQLRRFEQILQSARPPRKGARRTGRPPDTNKSNDRRIAEAWATGNYKGYADLAIAKGIAVREVKRALDRHRKRQPRRAAE